MKDHIRQMPIAALHYGCGAWELRREQIEELVAKILEFGFLTPIIVSADGCVLAGHERVEAAKIVGMEDVPCILESDYRAFFDFYGQGPEKIGSPPISGGKLG